MNISDLYPLTINRTRSLKQMIAAGRYAYQHPDITAEHFPLNSGGHQQRAVAVLVHFERFITNTAAKRAITRLDLRQADLDEILAFGAEYRDVQRLFPIVELGSVWEDHYRNRSVAYLCVHNGERQLDLRRIENDWHDDYRFLAVAR